MPPSPLNARVSGVLCMIAGGLALLGSFVLAVIGVAGFTVLGSTVRGTPHGIPLLPLVLFIPLSVLVFAFGIVAIVGGLSGLRRQRFWLLVVGALASVFTFLPLGIVALIFALLSEREFSTPTRPPA
jgi:hypothetical protein